MRLAPVILAASACSGGTTSTGFAVDGNVTGTGQPATGVVVVAWEIAAQPPLTYKFGDGTATKSAFMLDLATDPPAFAVNTNGVAVGRVVLLADGTQIPDGKVDLSTQQLGASADYAIIWKSATATQVHAWEASFGARYSCAHCVRGGAGSLDSFELTGCATVTVVAPAGTPCAWY